MYVKKCSSRFPESVLCCVRRYGKLALHFLAVIIHGWYILDETVDLAFKNCNDIEIIIIIII